MDESRQLLSQKHHSDYVPRCAHRRYVEMMRKSGIPEVECAKVEGCHNTLWREFVCPDADRHYEKKRMVVPLGCHSRYCPVCTNARVLREVRCILYNVKRWYRAMAVSPMFFEAETTLPPDLRARVNENNIDALSQECYAAMCEAVGGLAENASAINVTRDSQFRLGMWINFQNWSSEEPLTGGFNPHWHITLLSFKFDEENKPSLLFDGGCWISPEQLKRFKAAWTRRASRILGDSSYKETFVCHWHYADSYGKLRKRLAYQFRYSSMDVNRVCKDGFYWHQITKREAEQLKSLNFDKTESDSSYSAIGQKKGRYWLRQDLVLSKIDNIEFLRLVERPKRRKNVRPYGWLAGRSIKKCQESLGVVPIKKSVVQSELGKMYCTANVKRSGHIGLVQCGCLLERGDQVMTWDEVKELDAVILVREKQSFAVLREWDDVSR